MGSLKDELAKHFPEHEKPKKRKKRRKRPSQNEGNRETAALPADTETNWKKGVRPLKKNHKRPSPSPGKKSARKGTGMATRKEKHAGPSISVQRLHEIYSGTSGKSRKSAKEEAARTERRRPDPSTFPGALARAPLSRESEFKPSEAWVDSGRKLQPESSNGRVLPIRMGIDFGTAYTKTALRVADRVFFVDWDGIRSSDKPYVLPGEFSVSSNGHATPGRSPEASQVLNNLKLPFLSENEPTSEDLAAALVFLALIMRYSRAWLYRHHNQLLHDRQLAWEVNLGLPTASWESARIFEIYRRIGLSAWLLSQSDTISMQRAHDILNSPPSDAEEVELDGLYPIPEFAAQISGYIQSPQRQFGLHLLLDIGAGTVDIATFNVHKERRTEQNVLPIFANEVEFLGSHVLMAYRLEQLDQQMDDWDDLQMIPTSSELADQLDTDPETVSEIDAEFAEFTGIRIRAVLRHTRHDIYALAPEWEKGVRTFLAGGGSACEVYESALRKGFREHGTTCLKTKFPDISGLPTDIDETVFHRLTVAHGLSHDAEIIGKVRPQNEVTNLGFNDLPRKNKPDHEDMYTE